MSFDSDLNYTSMQDIVGGLANEIIADYPITPLPSQGPRGSTAPPSSSPTPFLPPSARTRSTRPIVYGLLRSKPRNSPTSGPPLASHSLGAASPPPSTQVPSHDARPQSPVTSDDSPAIEYDLRPGVDAAFQTILNCTNAADFATAVEKALDDCDASEQVLLVFRAYIDISSKNTAPAASFALPAALLARLKHVVGAIQPRRQKEYNHIHKLCTSYLSVRRTWGQPVIAHYFSAPTLQDASGRHFWEKCLKATRAHPADWSVVSRRLNRIIHYRITHPKARKRPPLPGRWINPDHSSLTPGDVEALSHWSQADLPDTALSLQELDKTRCIVDHHGLVRQLTVQEWRARAEEAAAEERRAAKAREAAAQKAALEKQKAEERQKKQQAEQRRKEAERQKKQEAEQRRKEAERQKQQRKEEEERQRRKDEEDQRRKKKEEEQRERERRRQEMEAAQRRKREEDRKQRETQASTDASDTTTTTTTTTTTATATAAAGAGTKQPSARQTSPTSNGVDQAKADAEAVATLVAMVHASHRSVDLEKAAAQLTMMAKVLQTEDSFTAVAWVKSCAVSPESPRKKGSAYASQISVCSEQELRDQLDAGEILDGPIILRSERKDDGKPHPLVAAYLDILHRDRLIRSSASGPSTSGKKQALRRDYKSEFDAAGCVRPDGSVIPPWHVNQVNLPWPRAAAPTFLNHPSLMLLAQVDYTAPFLELQPRPLVPALEFGFISTRHYFRGPCCSPLGGTWLHVLHGSMAVMVVSDLSPSEWTSFQTSPSSLRAALSPGRARTMLLRKDDMLYLPPGERSIYAMLSLEPCIVQGGHVWQFAGVKRALEHAAGVLKGVMGSRWLEPTEALTWIAGLRGVPEVVEGLLDVDPGAFGDLLQGEDKRIREACALLREVCEKEWALAREWADEKEAQAKKNEGAVS